MKLLLITLLLSFADFIVTEKLPSKSRQEIIVTEPVDVPELVEAPNEVGAVYCKCGQDCKCSPCICNLNLDIQIDKDAWEKNFKHNPKKKLQVITKPWCPGCPGFKTKFGDGNEFVELVYTEEDPKFVKYYPNLVQYPMIYDPETNVFAKGANMKDMDNIMSAFKVKPIVNKPPAFVGGTITKENLITTLHEIFEFTPKGKLELENDVEKIFDYNGVKITVQKKSTLSWVTEGDNWKVTLSPKAEVSYTVLSILPDVSAELDTILYNLKTDIATLELPGNIPDVKINIKDKLNQK